MPPVSNSPLRMPSTMRGSRYSPFHLLALALLGDVADHDDDAEPFAGVAGAGSEEGGRDEEVARVIVREADLYLLAVRRRGLVNRLQHQLVEAVIPGVFEKDLGIGAAGDLVGRQSEHPAGGRIERHNLAFEIEADHPVGHVDEDVFVNRRFPVCRTGAGGHDSLLL
jgi:hypothetical protein